MGLFSFDGGGAGNSTSSTTNTTENTDMRVVGGNDSSNQSLKLETGVLNNSSITLTDLGAIDGGLKLALRGIEGANAIAGQTVAAQGGLLQGALKMAGEQQAGFTSAIENIKTSDVRVLVVAGLAVVGLGAVFLFKKG